MTDLLRRQPEPLVVRPHDAMRILSCSRATLYRLLNHGEIEGYLQGTARLISVSSIKAYIARKLKAEPSRRMPAPPERRFYRPQHPSVPARRQDPKQARSPQNEKPGTVRLRAPGWTFFAFSL